MNDKEITPEAIDRLIDTLGEKTLKMNTGIAGDKLVQKPILIGNVLKKIWNTKDGDPRYRTALLIDLWMECDFTRSLQQIFSEEAWEEKTEFVRPCIDCECGRGCKKHDSKQLKPEPKALADFLLTLDLK